MIELIVGFGVGVVVGRYGFDYVVNKVKAVVERFRQPKE